MPVVTPPPVTVLPPPPDPNNRATFNALAYPWTVSLSTFRTQLAALGSNLFDNATDAATSASTASTQAGLATTNGAAQVTLATTQAGLATTNGAAQVTLATTQAGNANTSAVAAAGSASTASTQAASVLTMDKRYLGSKASAPTLDNQGAALATGAVYYDTSLAAVRTWNSTAWVIGISAVAGVSSVNGETGAVVLALLRNVAYDNRASLRALSPAAGDAAVVEGLGLFTWESASTEPDDDESSFATASGVWLLRAASWDVVDSWQSPDEAAQDEDDEDEPLRFASSFATKIRTGFATCAITSVSTVSSASFTGTVTGAAVGDRVIATPPGQLGSNSTETGKLAHHAWVSAADTVTIMLTNASAQAATTNPLIQAAWPVTVIKS